MLTPEQAWASIQAHVPPLARREIRLAEAAGHVLAGPVLADRDLPPAHRSAMDGFALRAADLPTSTALRVVGEVAAGSAEHPTVEHGTCVRIFTGANLPPGADTVVAKESAREAEPGRVAVPTALPVGANILRQGENARAGEVILPAGERLTSMRLAACASVGVDRVEVVPVPRVVVITTGRELLAPELPALPYQERDSNQTMLRAALLEAGFAAVTCERISDDRDAIALGLRRALAQAEVVLFSGGVSVGDYDFVPAAIASTGARTIIHGVAMRPGKPFLFAMAPGGLAIFGLPGNPLSAATGLHELVLPALRRMSGAGDEACRPLLSARLRTAVSSPPGRQTYRLASLTWTKAGPEVAPLRTQSSADLVAGGRADGAIVLPGDGREVEAGAMVDFRPWRRWP